ncbi:MAG: T9SS type A sorting domain-containing protein [Bacteroidales bacterium]|nr:T9SS type A sorting domain-containing protein [Bacteroidales bacterium]
MSSRKILISRIILFINVLLFPAFLFAQYPPPAGQPGTTAMHKDSSAFVGWATTCIIERGFINISDTSILYNGLNKASYGSYLYASGPADDLVVSLGDHGSALLGFDSPIVNRLGPDFAVFENSFGDSFLELGFVEVSSDGQRFVRFPAISLITENQQISTFDTIDATKIHNLAGKYRHAYGTPFDLEDIKDSSGIDLNQINYLRIVDVGGCLFTPYATYDSQGHKVNDPWPTPFDTGGFDLDAIGVIHNQLNALGDDHRLISIRIYPNPVTNKVTFESVDFTAVRVKISDPAGNVLIDSGIAGKTVLDLTSFPAGIYLANLTMKDGASVTKKIIKY